MSDDLRCFFAIPLPEATRAALASFCEEMSLALARDGARGDPRCVPHDQLHITLKFIDRLAPDAVPKLLQQVASRISRQPPFEVALAGIGAFPSARAARVLWLGVGSGASSIARAARAIDAGAARCGVERDRRPFQAHVTLARMRAETALALHALPAPEPASFAVDEVVLFESRLGRGGATHVELARLPFGRAPDALDGVFPDALTFD